MKLTNKFLQIITKLFGGHNLTKNKFIKKLYQKTLPTYVLYKSQKIFLNCDESIHMAKHNFESDTFNMSTFESEINIGDTVLDVGANIGMYTLSAAKIVGDSGKVYSFEPDPIVFSNLKKNVVMNNHKNVILTNKVWKQFI
jgi:protein-L-isoaspartate O-methyltransferase